MKEISFDSTELEEKESVKSETPVKYGSKKAPTVRTFRGDVDGMIKETGVTKNSVAIAEAERRQARGETKFPVEEEHTPLGKIIFILLLMLAFGIGTGAYALIGSRASLPFASEATTTQVVTDDEVTIDLFDKKKEEIISQVSTTFSKTVLKAGDTRTVEFRAKDERGSTGPASFAQLLRSTNTSKKGQQTAALLGSEMEYSIHYQNALAGIITLHPRNYAETFAAMLDWETDMASDLMPILNPWYGEKDTKQLERRAFHDERIGTVDARILSDVLGNTLISYAFVDKKTLLIAGNRDALADRLLSSP